MRPRLTYANVTATLALIIAVGGTSAFAATQLAKNSVGTKQIKKNAVTGAKIKKNAVTGAKIKKNAVTGTKVKNQSLTGDDLDLATLGTVPRANVANTLAPLEAVHVVGAPGEPQFENGSTSFVKDGPFTYPPVGFYKDHEGIVHLEGFANVDTGPGYVSVFTLPPGYRPPSGDLSRVFEQHEELITVVGGDGRVLAREKQTAALEGIAFRTES